MLQYFETLTDDSGNSLLGATVTVTNYPSGSLASIYNTNGTASPVANSTVTADITGQVSFYVPDGAYTLTYSYKSTVYKTKSPVQMLDPMGFVAGTDSGVANAYVVTDSRFPASLYTGLKSTLQVANSNTGAATYNLNSTGNQPLQNAGGGALTAGTLIANGIYQLQWTGSAWQILFTTLTAGQIGGLLWPENAAETAAGVTITNFARQNTPIYDMSRYGLWDNIANAGPPSSDVNSPIIQAVLDIAATHGGTLVFPYGDYSFYADLSGHSGYDIYIEGNGSTFRPYSSSPTQSCVFYCNNNPSSTGPYNNGSGGWYSSQTRFHDVNFSASKYTTVGGSGDVNHCVLLNGTAAKFFDCEFFGGILSSFYGYYTQYCEFYSCYWGGTTGQFPITFTAAVSGSSGTLTSPFAGPSGTWGLKTSTGQVLSATFTNGSTSVTGYSASITGSPTANAYCVIGAAVLLQSNGLSASSNECLFDRNQFFGSYYSLILQGAQKTRIRSCTLQGVATLTNVPQQGAISLQADGSGQYCGATTIWDCWFEVNSANHINGLGCSGTLIDGNVFWPTGGTSAVVFGTSGAPVEILDLKVVNNSWLGGGSPTFSIYQNGSAANVVSLTWRGNRGSSADDFAPTTLSLVPSGGPSAIRLDMEVSGNFTGTLTGCTTSPTATINYSIDGSCVDLKFSSALVATSNTTSCTVTGVPSVILPYATRYGVLMLQNNSVLAAGQCDITTSGVVDLYLNSSLTGFTNSGNKGVQGGTFRYPLYA